MAKTESKIDTTEAMDKIAEAKKAVLLLKALFNDLNITIKHTTKSMDNFRKACGKFNTIDAAEFACELAPHIKEAGEDNRQ